MENYCLNRVSVWADGKVLKMDSGDSCATLHVCSVPLNCTLKMI